MRSGFFAVHALDTLVLISTRRLMAEGPPLATLDASHLASALDGGADVVATDDRQLARAAMEAGLRVKTFSNRILVRDRAGTGCASPLRARAHRPAGSHSNASASAASVTGRCSGDVASGRHRRGVPLSSTAPTARPPSRNT